MIKLTNHSCRQLSSPDTRRRIDWIDALRALACFFVVFGHQMPKSGTFFFVVMTPVQMPLFFIISGFFLEGKHRGLKEIADFIIFRTLIPWIFLSFIWIDGIEILIGGGEDASSLVKTLYRMVSGAKNWFMICFLIANLVCFLICKMTDTKKAWVRISAMCTCSVAGLVLCRAGVGNFMKFNTALVVQLFLAMGMLMKKYLKQLLTLPGWTVLGAGFLYFALGVLTYFTQPGFNLDVNRNMYGNYIVPFSMVALGCYVLVRVFEWISQQVGFHWFILNIGKSTLAMYLVHPMLISDLKNSLGLIGITLPGVLIPAVVYTFLAIVLITFGNMALSRFCPLLVGAYRKKQ